MTGVPASGRQNDIDDPCGVLIVDKEKGMTSHDVVSAVRKHFRLKKVGHAGTLDPNATGVLVLLIGKATKLSGNFLSQDKEYEADMKLGERTDTGDGQGKVLSERPVSVSPREIEETLQGFIGDIEQLPPMFSAKKVKGKKLYELARRGIEAERETKKVIIHDIRLKEIDLPHVRFTVRCGKGTFIRQLVDDAGERLGCGAYLAELRRTRSGDFCISGSFSLRSVLEMDRRALDESLLRIQECL